MKTQRPSPASPRKQPVQARAQATMQAILEAAVQVFDQHGHAAGTTARIAERAGISIGSLYQYFPHKDAILQALAEQHLAEADAAARALLLAARATSLPLAELIGALVGGFLALHEQNPNLHRLLYEEGLLPPTIRRALRELELRYVGELAALLRGHPEVTAGDAALQAYFVIGTLEHFTHRLVLEPPGARLAGTAAAELKTLLLRYLGGAPATTIAP